MKSTIDKSNFKLIKLPEATREQMEGADKQYIKVNYKKKYEEDLWRVANGLESKKIESLGGGYEYSV